MFCVDGMINCLMCVVHQVSTYNIDNLVLCSQLFHYPLYFKDLTGVQCCISKILLSKSYVFTENHELLYELLP